MTKRRSSATASCISVSRYQHGSSKSSARLIDLVLNCNIQLCQFGIRIPHVIVNLRSRPRDLSVVRMMFRSGFKYLFYLKSLHWLTGSQGVADSR